MSTPAPSLSVTATSDAPSYAPGATVTIDAAALQQVLDVVTVSATLGDVSVNAEVQFTVSEPADGATFGITDTLGITWSQQAGTGPGSVILTGVIPASQSAA